MNKRNWMIYGVTGYSGYLIAKEAVKQGLKPVLAGRKRDEVMAVAKELGLEARIFPLDNPEQVASQLQDISLMLNCAGPYSKTARQTIEGCILAKTHYLDITGEIEVFEFGRSQDAAAKSAGVIVCSGVGFDVIPTDWVASCLHEHLPDATQLALAFALPPGLSKGTALSTIEGLKLGSYVRESGNLKNVPFGHRIREIDFGDGQTSTIASIPWGDVASAYHTTGIPNIETFTKLTPNIAKAMQWVNKIRPILTSSMVYPLLELWAKNVKGPEDSVRDKGDGFVWGGVRNAIGQIRVARMSVKGSGYHITIFGALKMVDVVLKNQTDSGYKTPSQLISWRESMSLEGCGPIKILKT